MSEIKEIYVIDWMGPYSSLEEVCERDGSENCFIYLIVGRRPRNRTIGIKYVGITKRAPNKRMADKDHQKKQEEIKDKKYWVGRFSVSSYNNLESKRNRNRAELIESLLVRYLSNISNEKMINVKKTLSDPKTPIGIISRWQRKYSEDSRYNKPRVLSKLPDTLIYADKEYWSADKMRFTLYTPE